jgi:hypothetical protein
VLLLLVPLMLPQLVLLLLLLLCQSEGSLLVARGSGTWSSYSSS